MKLVICSLAVGISLVLAPVHAQKLAPSASEILVEVGQQQREIELAVAPIRSRVDLRRHLRITSDSPINRLPMPTRQIFLSKLVFTKKGLGSFPYIELSQNLTVTEAYRILSLFGEQRSVGLIPGLNPKNSIEESMILVPAAAGSSGNPKPNSACIVSDSQSPDGGGASWCVYEYGSYCNAQCG